MWARRLFSVALAAAGLFVMALWFTEEAAAGVNSDIVKRTPQLWLDAINGPFCGQRLAYPRSGKIETSTRLSGGRRAWAGEFPWYAFISWRYRKESHRDQTVRHNCSGIWIHENLVMTAAHCVIDQDRRRYFNQDFRVHDWGRKYYTRVTRIYVHPDFPDRNLIGSMRPPSLPFKKDHADIAILRLQHPIRYDINKMPACLPIAPSVEHLLEKGCQIAGYGQVSSTTQYNWPNELMAMPMQRCPPYANDSERLRYFQDARCWYSASPLDYIGHPCLGDDGAGIFCPMKRANTRWYVRGVMNEQNPEGPCDLDWEHKNIGRAYFTDILTHRHAILQMAWELLAEVGMLPGQKNFNRNYSEPTHHRHQRRRHRDHI